MFTKLTFLQLVFVNAICIAFQHIRHHKLLVGAVDMHYVHRRNKQICYKSFASIWVARKP